jgi:Spy/CpxP family protein refolding chaperone
VGNNKIEMKQICIVTIFTLTFIFFNSLTAIAASEPGYKSIYIGQETRDIKSLSNEDINALRTGAGWGLAKAAELNGLPGPRHILDMKKEINLTTEQERMVRGLFNEMNKNAIELGNKYIEYEKELNNRFAERNIDENALDELLGKISEIYKSLRYTHLSAHLKASKILTEDQIKKYNRLRGYSSDDPCINTPQGHDPVMWRKHNNCD